MVEDRHKMVEDRNKMAEDRHKMTYDQDKMEGDRHKMVEDRNKMAEDRHTMADDSDKMATVDNMASMYSRLEAWCEQQRQDVRRIYGSDTLACELSFIIKCFI